MRPIISIFFVAVLSIVVNSKVIQAESSSTVPELGQPYKEPVVEIYTMPGCIGCNQVKEMFRSRGIVFKEIDVTKSKAIYEQMILRANGHTTVPQVFINGKHMGGYWDISSSDLDALVPKNPKKS